MAQKGEKQGTEGVVGWKKNKGKRRARERPPKSTFDIGGEEIKPFSFLVARALFFDSFIVGVVPSGFSSGPWRISQLHFALSTLKPLLSIFIIPIETTGVWTPWLIGNSWWVSFLFWMQWWRKGDPIVIFFGSAVLVTTQEKGWLWFSGTSIERDEEAVVGDWRGR